MKEEKNKGKEFLKWLFVTLGLVMMAGAVGMIVLGMTLVATHSAFLAFILAMEIFINLTILFFLITIFWFLFGRMAK